VDIENDSVCVCKRFKKPATPVRCTRPDLLHTNCNDRDEFRKMGFEIAPEDKVLEIYPDEAVRPAGGETLMHVVLTAKKKIG
jgi:hypothetical protein